MYVYSATVTDVYDGDTITVDLDLGLDVWLRGQKLRLYGIDAPEVRGEEREEGVTSRDWLREQILGETVKVHTLKDSKGKYGRWLAKVYFKGRYINAALVEEGLAEWKEY